VSENSKSMLFLILQITIKSVFIIFDFGKTC